MKCESRDVYFRLLSGIKDFTPAGTRLSISINPYGLQVSMHALLTAAPKREEYKAPHAPQDRYTKYPVADLNLEAAVFIVPEKKSFSEYEKLCSGLQKEATLGNKWSLIRQNNVTDCKLDPRPDLSPNSFICQLIDCSNDRKVYPSHNFAFNSTIPANEKWNRTTNPNFTEYMVDVSTIYYFDYSELDIATAKKFASNPPEGGDYDQYGRPMKFSGELDFMGVLGDYYHNSSYPSNAPVLNFDVTLSKGANKEETKALVEMLGKKMGVRKAQGWNETTVDNFDPIILKWPNVLPLTLVPGYNYTFSAQVSIQPLYDVGPLGGENLRKWVHSVSYSYSIIPVDFADRNLASVRLIITFDSTTTTLKNLTLYTLFDFITSLGSAIALFGLGMVILTCWQKISLPEVKKNIPNPYLAGKLQSLNSISLKDSDTEDSNDPSDQDYNYYLAE